MNGAQVGYIRVSSSDQNTDRQLDGVPLDKTFTDKVSGATAKRPGLEACFGYLREGDTLHIHSIDRLARNLMDLQRIVEDLNRRGVCVIFHKEGLTFDGADEDPAKQLMLQMLGAFAQFERALIRERQREGIEQAKKKGVRMGRPRKLTDELMRRASEYIGEGLTIAETARRLGVGRSTLSEALARKVSAG